MVGSWPRPPTPPGWAMQQVGSWGPPPHVPQGGPCSKVGSWGPRMTPGEQCNRWAPGPPLPPNAPLGGPPQQGGLLGPSPPPTLTPGTGPAAGGLRGAPSPGLALPPSSVGLSGHPSGELGGPPAPSSASAPAPWSCSSSGPPGSWNKRALGGLVPARGFRKIWKAAWGQARLLPPAATQALGLSPRNKAGQGLTWGGDSGLP